jgi:hypothetical protein
LQSIGQYMLVLTNLSYFLAPQVHVYDILAAHPFRWTTPLSILSNMMLALTFATLVLNSREYHYDSD